jgi:hypothetical protein
VLPRSHKDTARKAFERVTKLVLPASHTRLQRALAVEARSYRAKIGELEQCSQARRAPDAGAFVGRPGADAEPLGDDA